MGATEDLRKAVANQRQFQDAMRALADELAKDRDRNAAARTPIPPSTTSEEHRP